MLLLNNVEKKDIRFQIEAGRKFQSLEVAIVGIINEKI